MSTVTVEIRLRPGMDDRATEKIEGVTHAMPPMADRPVWSFKTEAATIYFSADVVAAVTVTT